MRSHATYNAYKVSKTSIYKRRERSHLHPPSDGLTFTSHGFGDVARGDFLEHRAKYWGVVDELPRMEFPLFAHG